MQSRISFVETVKTLLRHRRLADNRSYSSVQNKSAKAMIYISMAVCIIYLMSLSKKKKKKAHDEGNHQVDALQVNARTA